MDYKNYLHGKWFHTFKFDDEGRQKLNWQGQILEEVHPGYFAAQLYEWLVGGLGDQVIIHISDMKGGKFVIYESSELMNEAYDTRWKFRTENNKAK